MTIVILNGWAKCYDKNMPTISKVCYIKKYFKIIQNKVHYHETNN